MKHTFLFFSLFLFIICLGNAQETIEHTVSKGETVFQLSKTYNVSLEEIYALNPSARVVIKIDEVLYIPKKDNVPTSSSSSNENNSKSNTITYAVVYGDTKYSLARRFGISVETLELQNPHTRNGLQAGHILKFENQQNTSKPNANYTIKKTHLVLKGQTLWGISKANELTVEQLVNANSNILSGILQIGQVLDIPNSYEISNKDSRNTYVVQRGDTKYGLAKKYGVTINELEKSNSEIVRMLMAGTTIKIPQESHLYVAETSVDNNRASEDEVVIEETNTVTTPEETSPVEIVEETSPVETVEEIPSQPKSFVDYEIQAKETLYGLSKKAGMSISDFMALNPELNSGVNVGMIIKMPSTNPVETPIKSPVDEVTVKKPHQNYVDLRQTIKTVKKSQVLLFLPFSEAEYSNVYSEKLNFDEVSDDFLRENLEFYRGSKIAQDSAKTLGLDFDIKIVETNTSKGNSNASTLATESTIENYDAVLLPFYEKDTEQIAKMVQNNNIPVITTNSIVQKEGLKNLFNSVPSINSKRDVMLEYMNSKNGNLIVVCDMARKESKSYITDHAPNATFIDVNKRGTFNSDELIAQLDPNKINYIILESEKNSVFLSTTNLLLGQLSKYSIQLALLDKTLIPNTGEVSTKRFVILQMLYPSLSPLTKTSFSSDFIASYKNIYDAEPSENVGLGFDLTFDTLLRISQAKSFEHSADSDVTEYTSLKFEYKINTMGNYENNGIYLLQYNSDGSLKEID